LAEGAAEAGFIFCGVCGTAGSRALPDPALGVSGGAGKKRVPFGRLRAGSSSGVARVACDSASSG
jgi:hypothetical protein